MHHGHLCLVFEQLGVNLLQLLQQNQCRGLSVSLIRFFSKQLLKARRRPLRPARPPPPAAAAPRPRPSPRAPFLRAPARAPAPLDAHRPPSSSPF